MTQREADDIVISVHKANWPVILFMVGQTVAGIWWASKLSSDVDWMKQRIVDNAAVGVRDVARIQEQVTRLEIRVADHEKAFTTHVTSGK